MPSIPSSVTKAHEPRGVADLLRRDKQLAAVGLGAVTILSWAYTVHMARADHGAAMQHHVHPWRPADFALTFLMWSVMMIAMMAPSVAPYVFMVTKLNRRKAPDRSPMEATQFFLAGYLTAWAGYSLLATLAQWGLQQSGTLTPGLSAATPLFGGGLLIGAGVFQWTGLKNACLKQCRSPLGFLLAEWRDGIAGNFIMGLRHGVYCTVCCWAVMALLFVAGAMNLLWMAALTGFVLVEKLLPRGEIWARTGGVVMILAGVVLLAIR